MNSALRRLTGFGLCFALLPGACSDDDASSAPDTTVSTEPGTSAPRGPEAGQPADSYLPEGPTGCVGEQRDGGQGEFYLYFSCQVEGSPLVPAVAARPLPPGSTLHDAMTELLGGPTDGERALGIASNFGAATADVVFQVDQDDDLVTVDLDPSILEVDFMFVSVQEVAQITSTLGQFPGVEAVAIRVGGQPFCVATGDC